MNWPWSKKRNPPPDIELPDNTKQRLDEFDDRLTMVEQRIKAMRLDLQQREDRGYV